MFRVDTQHGGKRKPVSKATRKSASKATRKSGRKSASKSTRKSASKATRKSPPKRKSASKATRKSPPKRKSASKATRKSGRKSGRKCICKSGCKCCSKSGCKSSQRGGGRGGQGRKVTALTNDRSHDFANPRQTASPFYLPRSGYSQGVADHLQPGINAREALGRNMAETRQMIDNDCGWIKGSGLDPLESARLEADCARNVKERIDNKFNRPDHRDQINTFDPRTHTPAQWERNKTALRRVGSATATVGRGVLDYAVAPVARATYNYGVKPLASETGRRVRKSVERGTQRAKTAARSHINRTVDRGGGSDFEY
jgi:hypothetical protein